MPPALAVLDESKQRRHGILSVGGVVLDLGDLAEVERRWREARAEAGVKESAQVKYSMRWPEGPAQRAALIEAIGTLPARAAISLLEDFRPQAMKARKPTRTDSYVQRHAFDWLLQRLAGPLLVPEAPGPHLVVFDDRNDFAELQAVYAQAHRDGWSHLPHYPMPSLRERGFSQSLAWSSHGPLPEIADMLTSCVTRWADQRCIAHKGGRARDLAELDRCMTSLVDLFPMGGRPPRRCGHSIVVHTRRLTGKELLHEHLEGWIERLARRRGATEPSTAR